MFNILLIMKIFFPRPAPKVKADISSLLKWTAGDSIVGPACYIVTELWRLQLCSAL